MEQPVGTFAVADAFFITGRGLVLAGQLTGRVNPGQHLVFADGTRLRITSVNYVNQLNQFELYGLLVETTVASRAGAVQAGYVGATAQVVAIPYQEAVNS